MSTSDAESSNIHGHGPINGGGNRQNDAPFWGNPDISTVATIRRRIKMFVRTGRYDAAEFWMDKIANLSHYENMSDLLALCEYLFMDGQYAACRNIIQVGGLHQVRTDFRYWLGRCCFATGDYEEALRVLSVASSSDNSRSLQSVCRNIASRIDDEDEEVSEDDVCMAPTGPTAPSPDDERELEQQYMAAIQILKGKIYDKLDNRQLSCNAYLQALEIDPYSCDAFDYLVSRQALTAADTRRLMTDISGISQQSDPNELSLLEMFYRCKMSPESMMDMGDRNWESSKFATNPDFLLTKADYYLRKRDYVSALEITTKIMKAKPFHRTTLPIHVAALVNLGKSSLLFDLSHRLVTLYPQHVMSWYTTAAYYYVCGHNEVARRYLAKAISLDKSCGYVWLLYGHSFSREREHDQAMAAYFHAVDVMKGSFYPYIYIAREYVRTNNHVLAERFYGEAKQLAPSDPTVLHETGLLHIKKADAVKAQTVEGKKELLPESKKELLLAVENLEQAVEGIKVNSSQQKTVDSSVESIFEALATAHMKLRNGKEALKYATLAYRINPKNGTVLKLIGMANFMLGHLGLAVDALQASVSVNKEDNQTKKILMECVEKLAVEGITTLVGQVDLGMPPRRQRLAKGPLEVSRAAAKRGNARKSATTVASVVSKAVAEMMDSSAMDISLDTPVLSFLGEFQSVGTPTDPGGVEGEVLLEV